MSVFLLHSTGKTMRDWLWNDLFNVSGIYGNGLMPLYAVGTVIAVFTVGTVIDICRIRLVEAPFFALWDRHWPKIGRAYAAFEAKMCDKLHIGN